MSGNPFVFLATWISRLFYLNVIWILFTLAGLVVFGIFPATSAAFSVMRQWLMDKEDKKDFSVWKIFFQYYKADFIQSNILGTIVFLIGIVIYFDFQFLQSNSTDNALMNTFQFLFVVISVVLYIAGLYIFPVFVHYDLTIFSVIKNSVLLAVANPITGFIMVIGSILVIFITLNFPGLFLIFSTGLLTLILMGPSLRLFKKLG